MLQNKRISNWLTLCLLTCLLVLGITAPGMWQDVARRTTVDDLLVRMSDQHQEEKHCSVPPPPSLHPPNRPSDAWTLADAAAPLADEPVAAAVDKNVAAEADDHASEPILFDLKLAAPSGDLSQEVPDAAAADSVLDDYQAPSDQPSPPRVALIPNPTRMTPGMRLDPTFNQTRTPTINLKPASSLESTSNPKPDKTLASRPDPPSFSTPGPRSPEALSLRGNKEFRGREQPQQQTCKNSDAAEPRWPLPLSLFEQLDELAQVAAAKSWAAETRRLSKSLVAALSLPPGRKTNKRTLELFDLLRSQNRQADLLTARLDNDSAADMLRRCAYSLQRRLDLWQRIISMDPAAAAAPGTVTVSGNMQQLALAVSAVDSLLGNSDRAAAWRKFLLLDALKSLANEHEPSIVDQSGVANAELSRRLTDAQRRAVAGEVLTRVARSKLDEKQQQFLEREPLVQLGTQLRQITDATFDGRELVRLLELYEARELPSYAHLVAEESLRLAVARDPVQKTLGKKLAAHYCNPNIRLALSEDLLNRLIPEQMAELSPLHDTVLGRPVRGQSLTETDVAIRLIPDPQRLLLALEISGDVASITNSTTGPATFRNASSSRYVARKPMEITTDGIKLQPAEVTQVHNRMRLQAVRTDYDAIPLIGSLAQSVAISSHDAKHQQLQQEIKRKVAIRAKRRIDAEADSRLQETSQRLKTRLLDPLANLDIEPEMILAETTAQRLVMQLRLASDEQLAAHTFRPWAPSDSLMSLQIHQTAINNVLGGLKLDGARMTLAELREHVTTKLNLSKALEVDRKHDDVSITFALNDAVRIDCQDGRMAVTLAIARLEKTPRVWRNFQVRAYYRVRLDGLSAELVRDGSIRMVGRRVKTSSQFAIRSIFLRVFSKNASLQLVPDRIRNNPHMSNQVVTQFEIKDGWVAMAMGPQRR